MTLQEFLFELRGIPDGWFIDSANRIRRHDAHGNTQCPLTATYFKVKGSPIGISHGEDAGLEMGLSYDDYYDIMCAADGFVGHPLRPQLSNACGLDE